MDHWPEHKVDCSEPEITHLLARFDELRQSLHGRHAIADKRIEIQLLEEEEPDSRMAHSYWEDVDMVKVIRFSVGLFMLLSFRIFSSNDCSISS